MDASEIKAGMAVAQAKALRFLLRENPQSFTAEIYMALAERVEASPDRDEAHHLCVVLKAAAGWGHSDQLPVKPDPALVKKAYIALAAKDGPFDSQLVAAFAVAGYCLAQQCPELIDTDFLNAMKAVIGKIVRPITFPSHDTGDAILSCMDACASMLDANQAAYLEILPHQPLEDMLQATPDDQEAFNISVPLLVNLPQKAEEKKLPLLHQASLSRMAVLLAPEAKLYSSERLKNDLQETFPAIRLRFARER